MGRRTRERMVLYRPCGYGNQRRRYGVLGGVDDLLVKDGDLMEIVVAIIVIAVIIWFPWKKGGE